MQKAAYTESYFVICQNKLKYILITKIRCRLGTKTLTILPYKYRTTITIFEAIKLYAYFNKGHNIETFL